MNLAETIKQAEELFCSERNVHYQYEEIQTNNKKGVSDMYNNTPKPLTMPPFNKGPIAKYANMEIAQVPMTEDGLHALTSYLEILDPEDKKNGGKYADANKRKIRALETEISKRSGVVIGQVKPQQQTVGKIETSVQPESELVNQAININLTLEKINENIKEILMAITQKEPF
jgi:hypothetical protein